MVFICVLPAGGRRLAAAPASTRASRATCSASPSSSTAAPSSSSAACGSRSSLVAASWVATLVSFGLQPEPADEVEVATIVFYLGHGFDPGCRRSLLPDAARAGRAGVPPRPRGRTGTDPGPGRRARTAEPGGLPDRCGQPAGVGRGPRPGPRPRPSARDDRCRSSCSTSTASSTSTTSTATAVGDEVLQEVAGCLAQPRSATADLLARVGGDEFAVLCPNTGPEEARRLAESPGRPRGRDAGRPVACRSARPCCWPGAETDARHGPRRPSALREQARRYPPKAPR